MVIPRADSRAGGASLPPRRLLTSSNMPSTVGAMHGAAVLTGGQLQERQPGEGVLPVLPALRALFPAGGLIRGSVVAVDRYGLLCLALIAEASAGGAWCAAVGVPEFGVVAAAQAGAEPERLLLVPDPGPAWPRVAATLLEGCDIVIMRPPEQPSARPRQRLEAILRQSSGVLLVIGGWHGAAVRLRVTRQCWTGLGDGHGRLRACGAEVIAEGRGAAARPRGQWLWLPAPDGTVTGAGPEEAITGLPARVHRAADRTLQQADWDPESESTPPRESRPSAICSW
jgi:hypothetical protein